MKKSVLHYVLKVAFIFWVACSAFLVGRLSADEELKPADPYVIPDGKWDIYGAVQGYDAESGDPVYYTVARRVRDGEMNGMKTEVRGTDVRLLILKRKNIVNVGEGGLPGAHLPTNGQMMSAEGGKIKIN